MTLNQHNHTYGKSTCFKINNITKEWEITFPKRVSTPTSKTD